MYTSIHGGPTYLTKVSDTRGGDTKRNYPRSNPPALNGSISVCGIRSSTMHLANQGPHAHEQQQSYVFASAATGDDDCNAGECIEVTP